MASAHERNHAGAVSAPEGCQTDKEIGPTLRCQGWGAGGGCRSRYEECEHLSSLISLLWRSARAQTAQPGLLIPRPKPMATIAKRTYFSQVPLGQDKLEKEGGLGNLVFVVV